MRRSQYPCCRHLGQHLRFDIDNQFGPLLHVGSDADGHTTTHLALDEAYAVAVNLDWLGTDTDDPAPSVGLPADVDMESDVKETFRGDISMVRVSVFDSRSDRSVSISPKSAQQLATRLYAYLAEATVVVDVDEEEDEEA